MYEQFTGNHSEAFNYFADGSVLVHPSVKQRIFKLVVLNCPALASFVVDVYDSCCETTLEHRFHFSSSHKQVIVLFREFGARHTASPCNFPLRAELLQEGFNLLR
jgi:hypothetical protein